MMGRIAGLVLVATSYAWAADLPSGASLLDRYVEVTGGKAAYEARKSELMRGTIEYKIAGLRGSVVRYVRDANLYRATIEMPGVGAMDMGYRDGVAWQDSALIGPRILDGAEKSEALKDATLDPEYHWRQLYSKAETTGEETVNGEECYKVMLTPIGDDPEAWFFSKKTGYVVKMSAVTSTQQGDIPVDTFYSDYKQLGGVLRPTREVQRVAGQEIELRLDSAEVNVEIPAERFQFPAGVRALLAKQAK